MKKITKKMTNYVALVLCVTLLLQLFAVPGIGNWNMTAEAADSSETITYEDGFDYAAIDNLLDTPEWDVETIEMTATKPEISDGVIKMDTEESVQFNWMEVAGEFDATKTYTFEFDATVTNSGNGYKVKNNNSMTRSLYVAPGGYYNQVELNDSKTRVRAGDTYVSYDEATYKDQKLHIKLEWLGTTITSTITDEAGTVLVTGSRTNTLYTDMETRTNCMTYLVLRCEDGAVEIDNFSFAVDDTTAYTEDFGTNLFDTAEWDVETIEIAATKPEVSDGVIKIDTEESVQFNWMKVAGEFDATKTYTFEFDATVTNSGNGYKVENNNSMTRSLYVAPGGYYNQVELNDSKTRVRAGDTYVSYDEATYKDQKLHIKLEWLGTTITSTITDEAGTVLVTGSRTNTLYTDMETRTNCMTYLVLRCEDGAVQIDNFSFAVDGTTTYTEDFGTNPIDTMLATDIWDLQEAKTYANKPRLEDGIIKMFDKDSLKFNWPLVPEIKAYDSVSPYTYTFEFDATVTDSGDGSWGSSEAHTRVLYVAPDAYYNQIEINDSSNRVRAGETYITYDESVFSSMVHMKVEWRGNTIISTITDENGEIIARGRRTNANYNSETGYMDNLTLRCEDGAVEIDNFKFTQSYVEANQTTQEISIPEGQQAIYECKITYNACSDTRITLGGTTAANKTSAGDLFEISDYGMAIGGFMCEGTFGEGVYGVKAYLNPTQKAVSVEVTLPDGGVIRRGSHQFLYDCVSFNAVTADWSNITTPVADESVTYENISQADYDIVETEPDNSECGGNVYNLITSYDGDAKTTRSFAWTTVEGYVGDTESMSVKYREVGTDAWTTVAAVQETETTDITTEDFFKADITGLTAGTSYEYQVGKTDSESTDDWSATYTFTTQESVVDEFSFVAIGDTQGAVWYGTGAAATTKGFQYTQAAISQAMKEVENPAMILHTGDVTENGSLEQWNRYFKTLGDYGKTIPHFAGIGNHDVYAPGTHFDLHFNHPDNGGSDAFADDTMEKVEKIVSKLGITNNRAINLMKNADETVYSFDYGKAHFIALNSGVYDPTGEVDDVILEGQRAWLEADLEANADALWTIVIVHQPVYHRLGGVESRPTLYDTIESYGVDLVIQGHSHLVTRTYPMKNGQVVDNTITDEIQKGTGTVYTTIGATAMNHDKLSSGIGEEFLTAFTPQMEQATYTVIDVNNTELTFKVKQINGLVVDEFTITSGEKKIEYEYVSDITEYRGTEKTYPTKDGYVFAGWWQGEASDVITNDADLTPVTEDTTSGGAWAKYVPEEALSVKAQTSDRIADNPDSTKLRLVTTVDSLRYQEVGFKVKYNGGNIEYTHSTKTVYEEILAIDENDIPFKYKPSVFAAVSNYFVTYTIIDIDKSLFNTYEFDVTPYWITLDGTTVRGVPREDLLISDQLNSNN